MSPIILFIKWCVSIRVHTNQYYNLTSADMYYMCGSNIYVKAG